MSRTNVAVLKTEVRHRPSSAPAQESTPEGLDITPDHTLSPAESVTRFWAKVAVGDGCWKWTGATDSDGYGKVRRAGAFVRAHRFAWIVTHGDIPAGLMVCHRCDNPPCVRPDHLFLGTAGDNSRDAESKGRLANPMKGKPTCKWGHPFEGDNLVWSKDGKVRLCRACRQRFIDTRRERIAAARAA